LRQITASSDLPAWAMCQVPLGYREAAAAGHLLVKAVQLGRADDQPRCDTPSLMRGWQAKSVQDRRVHTSDLGKSS